MGKDSDRGRSDPISTNPTLRARASPDSPQGGFPMSINPDWIAARNNLRHVDQPAKRFQQDLRHDPNHPNRGQEIRTHGFLGYGGTTGTEQIYLNQGGAQHPYFTLTAADRDLLNQGLQVELKANPAAVVPGRTLGNKVLP